MAAEWTLAIDFGTSATVAAVQQGDDPPIIVSFEGGIQMPSAVLLTLQEEFVVGAFAINQRRMYPDRFVATPKREMRYSDIPMGIPVATVDVIAAVLARAASEAKRMNDGRAPASVVLTHPATWHEPRRAMLTEAAGRAGLEPVELLPEPQAAALMYAEIHSIDAPVAVYDLGAGTFDVTVVEATDAGIAVRGAPKGIDPLGGLTFDQKLFEVLEARFAVERPDEWAKLSQPSNPSEFAERFALDNDIRTAKEALTENNSWEIPVLGTVMLVTRDELEELIRPEVQRTIDLTLEVIASAGLQPTELGGLFMVGGASRVPLVKTMLYDALGVQPRTELDPKTVVALGGLRWSAAREVVEVVEVAQVADEGPDAESRDGSPEGGDDTFVGGATPHASDDWPMATDTHPGRSSLGTLAALLLAGAALLGIVALFPSFSGTGVRSSGAARDIFYLAMAVTWGLSAMMLRSRQAALLLVGAFFVTGSTIAQVGTPLSQLGAATPEAGFWLAIGGFLLAGAGVCTGVTALLRIHLLGHPNPIASTMAIWRTRGSAIGVLVATALLVISFLMPWAGVASIAHTFDVSLVSSIGVAWTALGLALIPIVALLWRPTLAGMALLAGLLWSQAFLVLGHIVNHGANIWVYLQIIAIAGLAGLFAVIARARKEKIESTDPRQTSEPAPPTLAEPV